jgi:hypothetical protein
MRGPDTLEITEHYDWTDTAPIHTIEIEKLEDGTYRTFVPCFPDLDPRTADDRSDAIAATQKQLWVYMESNRNAAKANAED